MSDEHEFQNDFDDTMNNLTEHAAAFSAGEHVHPEDLLLYTLALLSPAEARPVETHLQGCPLCRQELAAVHEGISMYALGSVVAEDPPARSRERLLSEVAAHSERVRQMPINPPAAAAAGTGAGAFGVLEGGRPAVASSGGRRPGLAGWAGWAVAAALAVSAQHFYQGRQASREALAAQTGQLAELSADEARARARLVHLSAEQAQARQIVETLSDRTAQRVTLTRTPAEVAPTGRATYLASRGTLIFVASHLAPLPAGKTYELWVIPASGAAPLPAGTFRPDPAGNATVVTARLEGAVPAKAFGVTLENAGGAQTPTLPILLAGS